ncbi:prolipoprotein diacylglyceryl transferase [bacterium]|nr:MAG: prolipoprotein diacylglyceryl transferase [bacterium]
MYLIWNPNPILFQSGDFAIGWYGLLFTLGFFLSQRLIIFVYHREKKPELDVLLLYLIAGAVIGARLGHVLFYDPAYFLLHPLAILKVWEGGLASHGAVAGMVIALWLFSKRHPDHAFFWLLDRITIVALMTGALVRVGNFINSEIVGIPTGAGYGVVFAADAVREIGQQPGVMQVSVERRTEPSESRPGLVPLTLAIDVRTSGTPPAFMENFFHHTLYPAVFKQPGVRQSFQETGGTSESETVVPIQGGFEGKFNVLGIARHPVQLYEAAVALALGIWLFTIWWKKKSAVPPGLLIGWCLVLLFASRFLLEYLKEDLIPIEAGLPLKIGQLLSIPFIALGVWLVRRAQILPTHAP